jgi:hypothetical protein
VAASRLDHGHDAWALLVGRDEREDPVGAVGSVGAVGGVGHRRSIATGRRSILMTASGTIANVLDIARTPP